MGNDASVFLMCTLNYKPSSVKPQLETFSLFFQPQPGLVLKLFLTFSQSEPHCSYKVVFIKKACSFKISHNLDKGIERASFFELVLKMNFKFSTLNNLNYELGIAIYL